MTSLRFGSFREYLTRPDGVRHAAEQPRRMLNCGWGFVQYRKTRRGRSDANILTTDARRDKVSSTNIETMFRHMWPRNLVDRHERRLTILDCGGKRSATPLWRTNWTTECATTSESAVAATLCRRSPKVVLRNFVIAVRPTFYRGAASARRVPALRQSRFQPWFPDLFSPRDRGFCKLSCQTWLPVSRGRPSRLRFSS